MTGDARDLRLLEALLFAASEPLDTATLSERLPPEADVGALIARLKDDYDGRGVNLVRVAGKWALRTAEDLAADLHRHVDVTRKLSRAAVETLAIIAYHQPVTRAEIEALRGVSLSRGTLDILVETGWVRPGRRRRTPGRPATWLTTDTFLNHFSLDSLDDLPGVEELRAAGLLDARQGTLGFDIGGADAQAEGGEAAVDQAEANDEAADPDA
ncbi:MAG: SMC-Scp complex subunit ScpB [Proteobacteria bacterium]|nr:SMC-Scp complex subunit ScpB [Pseudomonadota bacterium]